MKLKEYFYLLGFKPRDKRYGYEVKRFQLQSHGTVSYAQWLHPYEDQKQITDAQVKMLQSFINEGDFCIDIGAHSGDTTVPMALAAGKSGLVLALEPNPFIYSVLNKNALLNQTNTNIIPLMAAATQNDEDVVFEYSDSGFCNGGLHENISKWKHGHAFSLTVTGVQLSNLLQQKYADRLPRLQYIKIDAEGFDLSVVRSIQDIVDQYKPHIQIEVNKYTSVEYRQSMRSFFAERNYSMYKVIDNGNFRGDEMTPDNLMNWKHYDMFCVPNS